MPEMQRRYKYLRIKNMANIAFAAFSPHAPIFLPNVGSERDRQKVKATIESLKKLGEDLKSINPDVVLISSPHPDWGFQVPLYFLASTFQGEIRGLETGLESPKDYFEEGKSIFRDFDKNKKYALIGSGDLSHALKEEGPYSFHPDGPAFDQELIESLKKKDIKNILELDEKYPNAADCGLRPFSFILGILEASKVDYVPEILSYEGPFGVGYLVVNFKFKQ